MSNKLVLIVERLVSVAAKLLILVTIGLLPRRRLIHELVVRRRSLVLELVVWRTLVLELVGRLILSSRRLILTDELLIVGSRKLTLLVEVSSVVELSVLIIGGLIISVE